MRKVIKKLDEAQDHAVGYDVSKAIQDAIDMLEKMCWVSVDVRLPKVNQSILAHSPRGFACRAGWARWGVG